MVLKSTTKLKYDITFLYHMLQESTIWNVAGVFFKEPVQEHYLKEISRKAGVAHTVVKKHLSELAKEGIIKETVHKRGSRKFPTYFANINGGAYRRAKGHYNLHNTSFYGLFNYLSTNLMPKTIVLFGSYARGEDIEESDIDIFVECKKQDIDLKKYEHYRELNRKIQLHFKKDFKQFPKEMKNNIINGIVLHGYLEAF